MSHSELVEEVIGDQALAQYWQTALGFVRSSRNAGVDRPRTQYEARPDYCGWLLHSFGQLGLPSGRLGLGHP